jgi:hypothetical protein
MKKPWLLIGIALAAGALALGAVACGDDDDDGGGNGEEPTATEAAPAEEATPTEAAGETPEDGETPSAEGETIDVILAESEGSGVTGLATITTTDAGFDVELSIDGGLTEGEHANHIHVGTCEARGDVVETLTPLQADASGAVEATSTSIASPLADFTTGNNYFAVHATDGTVVACGDIPAA